MVVEEIKNIKSGRKELRQFGITIGIIMGMFSIWLTWLGEKEFLYLSIVSVFFIFFAFFLPTLLKPFHKVWMTFAILMSWLITSIIMIVLFYLLVTPIGLLAKLCGRDFLNRRFDKDVKTYWIPREIVKRNKKSYENQF